MNVTKFKIQESNLIILDDPELVVGKTGIHKKYIASELDITVIETDLDIISFSPLFEKSVISKVWRWAQGKNITNVPKTTVPEFMFDTATAISRK